MVRWFVSQVISITSVKGRKKKKDWNRGLALVYGKGVKMCLGGLLNQRTILILNIKRDPLCKIMIKLHQNSQFDEGGGWG